MSRPKRRDLSKYETLYEDPEYEKLRAEAARRRSDRLTTGALTGGSALETLGGLAATVLSVIGFQHRPVEMCAIATIAHGVALLSLGASIMARWHDALRRARGSKLERRELIEGVSTEVFGGCVGIVIGIVALAGVQPLVVLPVAAIVFGGSLLLGGATQPDLVYLAPAHDQRGGRITFSAIQASGGIMIIVGVAAAVLGVLALLAIGPPLVLALVAMLAIGFALVVAGGALTARFVRRLP